MRRSAAVAAVLTVLVSVTTACSRGDDRPGPRLAVQGVAEVEREGEPPRRVDGDRSVEAGDRVRVTEGTAVLRLAPERQLELRRGTVVGLAAGPDDSVRADLVDGPLLVTTTGPPATVTSMGSEILVTGASRLSRAADLTIASYRGSTEVTAGGRTTSVGAYRQVTASTTDPLLGPPSPVRYDAADPWDQRLLGDAAELGAQLLAKSRGFTSQSPAGQFRTPSEFAGLLPPLQAEPAFASLFDPARPVGETLVGAAIVLESSKGAFEERWRNVFGFRGDGPDGADWGFVALDQGVDRAALVRRIDDAIGRAPTPVFAGGTVPPATRAPSASVPRRRTTVTTAAPSAAPTTTITLPPPAGPPSPPGPLNTGAPLLDETVNSLLETLDGLLRGLGGA